MQVATNIPGLAGTAAALQSGQARFDAKAQRVLDDASAMADADVESSEPASGQEPEASSSSLSGDLVSMNTESLVNQLMFGVYRKQQEQSQDLLDIIKPKA